MMHSYWIPVTKEIARVINFGAFKQSCSIANRISSDQVNYVARMIAEYVVEKNLPLVFAENFGENGLEQRPAVNLNF
jgi:hypothetical protein